MTLLRKILTIALMGSASFTFAKGNADTIFYVLYELLNDRMPDLSTAQKLKYG